ncbi:unnamed protein product, partial [Staurois parvus]
CKRSQAGRVNNNQAGRYRGSGREWSGHKPGIKQEKSAEVRIRQSRQQISQTGTGMQVTRYRGPWKNTHQGTDCRSGHPLNTPAISLRCLADCRVESLIAESTRWPALVLQPTRQVSPTIIGKSIPDS